MELFQQTSFNWGFSEDDREANRDQYLYASNIDTYSQPEFIQLSNKMELVFNTNWEIHQFIDINDRVTNTIRTIAFWTNEIYNLDSSTPVYSDVTLGLLQYPVFVLGQYLYWVRYTSPTWAFKIDRIRTVSTWVGTWIPELDHLTLSNNDYFEYSSVVTVGNEAYISLGNVIEYLKADETTVPYTDLVQQEIVGMAELPQGIMIFTEDGKMHNWDGLSEFVTSTVNMNVNCGKIYQYGTAIFGLSGARGTEQGFYQFDGSRWIPIMKENFSQKVQEFKGRFDILPQSITNNRENMYLLDDNKLCFYWNKVSGTKKGFHYINTVNSSWDAPNNATAIHYRNSQNLYYAWNNWGLYGIDRISPNTKNSQGYLVTNTTDYDTAIVKKNTLNYYFKVYGTIDEDHEIIVQASIDDGNFTTIKTVTEMPKDNIVRINSKNFKDSGITASFNEITFKFIPTSNDSETPKIWRGYSHQVEFNSII